MLAGPAATHRGLKPVRINREEGEYTYARLGTEQAGLLFSQVSGEGFSTVLADTCTVFTDLRASRISRWLKQNTVISTRHNLP